MKILTGKQQAEITALIVKMQLLINECELEKAFKLTDMLASLGNKVLDIKYLTTIPKLINEYNKK